MTLPLEELGLYSSVLVWQAGLLTLISFAVGVLGGFVGLALGTIRLPALLLMGIASPTAAGTNIAVSAAGALAGAVRHLREGRVALRVVVVVGVPSMAGAFMGAVGSHAVPEALLTLSVGLLVVWQGVGLVVRSRAGDTGSPSGPAEDAVKAAGTGRLFAGAGGGLAVGMLGGAVGLILGTIRLPLLIGVLHVAPRTAAGTNLVIGFVMGSMGWIGHVLYGQVDYALVALLATSAMAGSYLGARMTGRVSLSRLLLSMGLVMLVSGTLLVWRAVRM